MQVTDSSSEVTEDTERDHHGDTDTRRALGGRRPSGRRLSETAIWKTSAVTLGLAFQIVVSPNRAARGPPGAERLFLTRRLRAPASPWVILFRVLRPLREPNPRLNVTSAIENI